MKMEKYDFCSTAHHPLHSYPPLPFTCSSITEFNSQYEPRFFNDPNIFSPLLPLPYEPEADPGFPSLPLPLHFHHTQLHDLDFSLYSSDIQDPDTLHSFFKPLPDPHPLQQPHRLPPLSSSSPKPKRTRLDLNLSNSNSDNSNNNPQTFDSIVQSFKSPPTIIPHSELARKRRQKLSEKTRCLQKLMPWDKKMDTGTMLQEAHKYIQFLQAQVSILQSMPITSSFPSSTEHVNASFGFEFAGLGRLNRQQLLQVLVNSPVAQTMLCSHGFCVFASEQLVSLDKAKEKKSALQQYLCGN